MNKFFVSAIAGLGVLLGTTACNDEKAAPIAKGVERDVTLTVSAPDDFRSRAGNVFYGDGAENVLNLTYAIYRSDGAIIYSSEKAGSPVAAQTAHGKWTITARLMSEDTYHVVFWADQFGTDAKNPYTIDLDKGTLTVDYAKSLAPENLLSDRSDAYILYTDFIAEDGMTFTMKRPFCQVNVGSNEDVIKKSDGYYHSVPTAVGLGFADSFVTNALPNVLNYKTGVVTGITTGKNSPDMIASDFDAAKYRFPYNKGVQYMYMAYILAPQSSDKWGDSSININKLCLRLDLGKHPFTGVRRNPFFIDGMKDLFLANNRIVLVPQCVELPDPNGPDPVNPDPDPDPEPDPDKPGFIEDNYTVNIIFNPGFNNSKVIRGN